MSERYATYVRERTETGWWRYISELERVGRLVRLGRVHIDGESVFRRRFTCDTRTCAPGAKPGGGRWRRAGEKSCCAELTVDLSPVEVAALERHWEPIRDYLASKSSFYADKQVADMLELGADYEVAFKKRGGRCIFALKDGEWGIRCGIHSACLDLGIPVTEAKPVTCDTFPLVVIDLGKEDFYLGAHDNDVDGLVSIDDDGVNPFPCLANPRRGKRMYEAMESTIRLYFGDAFYDDLCRAAAVYLSGPRPRRLVPPWER